MEYKGCGRKRWKTAEEAIAMLSRNGAKVGGSVVMVEKPGLKTLAALDYLKNYCGFAVAIKAAA